MTVTVRLLLSASLACFGARTSAPARTQHDGDGGPALWRVYHDALAGAKYVDLTHTITPSIPVWPGLGPATFGPTLDPRTGKPYRWDKDGFEATRYVLATDQFGTQLDPPAHWNPNFPAIDELPPTFAVRWARCRRARFRGRRSRCTGTRRRACG